MTQKEEIKQLLGGLKKLDYNAPLYEYCQTILELTYSLDHVKLRQEVNSANAEHWLATEGLTCRFSSKIGTLIECLEFIVLDE